MSLWVFRHGGEVVATFDGDAREMTEAADALAAALGSPVAVYPVEEYGKTAIGQIEAARSEARTFSLLLAKELGIVRLLDWLNRRLPS